MHLTSRQSLRQTIRQKRRSLTLKEQHIAAILLRDKLYSHPKIQSAQHIALFLSMPEEIDTQPLIDALWAQNKQLYLPVIHPTILGKMQFIHYTCQSVLKPNKLSILEPVWQNEDVINITDLDVILTPLVAFDDQGNRLGMGGGYYDRILQNYTQIGVYPIGIGHDCQKVDKIPCESWDIPLPEIITPHYHIINQTQ